MSSKVVPSLFLLITLLCSSCFDVGLCQNSFDLEKLLPASLSGHGEFVQDAQCMQKLIPCQAYVKNPGNPSESCCEPLKEMHDTNKGCLCNFLRNPSFLQSIKASQEDILKLPEACGTTINVDNCNFTTAGATSPAADGQGSVPEGYTDGANDSHSTKMIAKYGFVAILIALVF